MSGKVKTKKQYPENIKSLLGLSLPGFPVRQDWFLPLRRLSWPDGLPER